MGVVGCIRRNLHVPYYSYVVSLYYILSVWNPFDSAWSAFSLCELLRVSVYLVSLFLLLPVICRKFLFLATNFAIKRLDEMLEDFSEYVFLLRISHIYRFKSEFSDPIEMMSNEKLITFRTSNTYPRIEWFNGRTLHVTRLSGECARAIFQSSKCLPIDCCIRQRI